ncbi:MAG TPA: phospholipase D-like domain-containing protein [Oligoflexia bacterium]|nr:phospholipase D-like domain-containing protein [Oligoflexia bacterium]
MSSTRGRIAVLVLIVGVCVARPVLSKVEVYFSPRGGCERRIVQVIKGAKTQIDVAMYRLNNLTILGELEKAKARGVQIRILVDRVRAMQNKPLLIALKEERKFDIRVHTKNREQHNSFAVVDGEIALSGSYDWYTMAELFNEENCVVIHDPEAVAKFQKHFDGHLWKDNSSYKSDDFFAYMEGERKAPRRPRLNQEDLNAPQDRVPASVSKKKDSFESGS